MKLLAFLTGFQEISLILGFGIVLFVVLVYLGQMEDA